MQEASHLPSGVNLASLYRDADAETRAGLQALFGSQPTQSPADASASPDAKATLSPAATASTSAAGSAGAADKAPDALEVVLRNALADLLAHKVLQLHQDFRADVGLMGIGLTSAPRKDTVAEVGDWLIGWVEELFVVHQCNSISLLI